jgi:hypothetical protein
VLLPAGANLHSPAASTSTVTPWSGTSWISSVPSIPTQCRRTADRPTALRRIAVRWADHRQLPQIAFEPDWTKRAKAASFKRNGLMLDVLPIGVLVFASTGIQENMADKARKLGIPIWKFGNGDA